MRSLTTRITAAAILAAITVTAMSTDATAADDPPGAIKLLPGYTHERKQGFDSIPGVITKKGGLQITYDIGSIPKPGAPRFGGQFTDQAKGTPAAQRLWYKEQTINGQPVHIALNKQNYLVASYPKGGINFSAKVEKLEELADALLSILSYPEAPKKAVSKKK